MMEYMMEDYMETIEEQLIVDLFSVSEELAHEAIVNSRGNIRKIKSYIKRKIKKENVQPTKCKLCGKRLTDPESIERGYGSECYKKLNTARREISIFGGDDVK